MNLKSLSPGRVLALSLGICAIGQPAVAQDAAAAKAQLPQQVLPTGAEDAAAPAARSSTARSAAARSVAPAADDTDRLVQELIEMTSESGDGVKVVQHGDGSSSARLGNRFHSVAIAKPTKDGGYELSCSTGDGAVAHAKHAHAIMTGKAAPVAGKQQPALEEK